MRPSIPHLPALGLLLVLALAAMSASVGAATPVQDAPATAGPTVHVVTLNLYHDQQHWPQRRVEIARVLGDLRPDVIALQEVLEHEQLQNQAQWLGQALGYQVHFITNDPPSRPRRYGNALLTRGVVLERGETLLHPLDDYRVAGMVRLLVEGQPLNVYVTHLHWRPEGGAIRARQIDDLLAWIDVTDDGLPSVIAGDFNVPTEAPELAALRARYDDAWDILPLPRPPPPPSTLNPHFYPEQRVRIDHVFLQRGRLASSSVGLLFTEPDASGLWASDHLGLSVHARLLPAP